VRSRCRTSSRSPPSSSRCRSECDTATAMPVVLFQLLIVSVCVCVCVGGPVVLPANDPFSQFFASLIGAPPLSAANLSTPAGAAAPVGQLLSLPANTHLFGLPENGEHLYIRPCYPLLLAAILSLFATWSGVLVKGVAGVGKVSQWTQSPSRCAHSCIALGSLTDALLLCVAIPLVSLRCVPDSVFSLDRMYNRV
jgi:hypothetical protein